VASGTDKRCVASGTDKRCVASGTDKRYVPPRATATGTDND
jgi:hypothetical protein